MQLRAWVMAPCFFALALSACKSAPKGAPPRVFVSNEDAGTVTVIDTSTDAVVQTITVGKRPRGLRVAPNGKLLYVALSGSPKAPPGADESKLPPADRAADGIGVVDLATGKLLEVLPSGQDPESFDVRPDGRFLFVSNEETAKASVLDLGTKAIVKTVDVGGEPEGVGVSPDGRVVYVTSEEEAKVTAIDTTTHEVLGSVPTGKRPRGIAFSPDSARAYVTSEVGADVTVIDTKTTKALGHVAIAPGSKGPARPMGIRTSSDGKWLYVSNGRAGSVSVIDAAGMRVEKTIETVGARRGGLEVTPDGKRLYVAAGPTNDVAVVDVESGAVVKRIPAGASPWGVAISK